MYSSTNPDCLDYSRFFVCIIPDYAILSVEKSKEFLIQISDSNHVIHIIVIGCTLYHIPVLHSHPYNVILGYADVFDISFKKL